MSGKYWITLGSAFVEPRDLNPCSSFCDSDECDTVLWFGYAGVIVDLFGCDEWYTIKIEDDVILRSGVADSIDIV